LFAILSQFFGGGYDAPVDHAWGFLLLFGNGGGVWAASDKAMALRQAQGLVAFTPTDKFLSGNFVADEMNPAFIFGPVKAFVASRPCPTTWLLEAGAGQAKTRPRNILFIWKKTARTKSSTTSSSTRAL
jgi:hypothetical protein